MAIIRDDKGNIYNIPDSELTKYLVRSAETPRPATLCLEPVFDAQRGPHDGWAYVKGARPKKIAKKTTIGMKSGGKSR
ncbi:hypothetical protein FRZ61_47550 [Hypericibacter adhaerens]|jgi:hypothetical protein|uniref:Uncharacterized protein n=1 Tax=Hypericibacter adhaerens TaxID=2602016 RepID=A0A5J6N7I9_9PROT|nr:hypothetical protein FRZ61_47550 [Hypericibacter adhaerens]